MTSPNLLLSYPGYPNHLFYRYVQTTPSSKVYDKELIPVKYTCIYTFLFLIKYLFNYIYLHSNHYSRTIELQ